MNLEKALKLKNVADNVPRSDKIAEAVDTIMVPELANMIAQKEELEKTIKAVSQAFEYSFAECFTTDTGFDTEPFYTAFEAHIEALQNQAVQVQIQHAQAQAVAQAQSQMQAAQAAQAPTQDANMPDTCILWFTYQ